MDELGRGIIYQARGHRIPEGRRERITLRLFPVGQAPSGEEPSKAALSITPTEEERARVGDEEEETGGTRRGRAHCSTTQLQRRELAYRSLTQNQN